mmetsp:Transcript_40665/g.97497  ORF Transcript_40665/g.97497 Transcript_40665/m.97497 type:complete len:832 (-) Transcript_40665:177-2672(-)
MHHELQGPVLQAGPALGHIREHRQLHLPVVQRQHGVHRVVVAGHGLGDVQRGVGGAAGVELALDHLPAVGVRVEGALGGDVGVVADDHLLAPVGGHVGGDLHPRGINRDGTHGVLHLHVRLVLHKPDHVGHPAAESLVDLRDQVALHHLQGRLRRGPRVHQLRGVRPEHVRAAGLVAARVLVRADVRGAPSYRGVVPAPLDAHVHSHPALHVLHALQLGGLRVKRELVHPVGHNHRVAPHGPLLRHLRPGSLLRCKYPVPHVPHLHGEGEDVSGLVGQGSLLLLDLLLREVVVVDVQQGQLVGAVVDGNHLARHSLANRAGHPPARADHRQPRHGHRLLPQRVPGGHREFLLRYRESTHGDVQAVPRGVAVAVLQIGIDAGQLLQGQRHTNLNLVVRLRNPLRVIVGHVLALRAAHPVVVGRHPDGPLQRVRPGVPDHRAGPGGGRVHVLLGHSAEHLQLPGGVQEVGRGADLALEGGPGGEVPGPVVVGGVGQGEDVVVADLPLLVGLVLLLGVHRRRGIERVHRPVLVDVVDELVEVVVPVLRVLVVEIRPGRPQLVVGLGVRRLCHGVLDELVHVLVHVVVVALGVVLDLIVAVVEIKPATVPTASGPVELPSKHARRRPHGLTALPDPLQALLVLAHVEVLEVRAAPEQALHASLRGQQPGVGAGVTKGVDLPGATRNGVLSEVLEQELVPAGGLVHHLHVVGGGLVVHAPPAVDELQPALLHEGAGNVALPVRLLVPPPGEERNLHEHEATVGVVPQPLHDGVNDVVDLVKKILIDGHLPAGVIVGVGHNVHVDLALDRSPLGVVNPVRRRLVRRLHSVLLMRRKG